MTAPGFHPGPLAYFEDMTPDFVARAGGYLVTEEEILEFGRRFDPQPFHTDPVAAKDSVFGKLVAPGTLIICARSWLVNNLDRCPAYSAGLGVEHMNLVRAVGAGDTLRLEIRVIEARPSQSRPDHGIVTCKNLMFNQHDELVMELAPKMLVRKRPS
ncbi:MAG: MaoC family dehydratase N-terminal domain-containing protein [Pseudomonadales bacterium]|nr:MaoC family dehydratase N-terminal domain-containing protein [Pseudomonadales bacterium]